MQDPLSWIENQKKSSLKKKIVKKDKQEEYDDKQLQGLLVTNDLNDLEIGKDLVLVLKDSDILKDEEDVLQLQFDQKLKDKSLEEEEDTIKSLGFRIDYDGLGQSGCLGLESKNALLEKDKKGVSLFVEKKIVSDQDLVFKKRKNRKNKREKEDFSLGELKIGTNKKKIVGDFVDDDDLQEFISKTRRSRVVQGAEFVKNSVLDILEKESADSGGVSEGLVISEATEFIRNIMGKDEKDERSVSFSTEIKQEIKQEIRQEIKQEINEDEEKEIKQEIKQERTVHFEDMDVEKEKEEEEEDNAFQAEPLVSAGLGATLALLSQKGLVQRLSPQEQERANKLRERELWLVEQRKMDKMRMVEKERERESQRSSGRKLSGRDYERQREADAKRLEMEQIKLKEEKFKNYVPDVKIAYYDEFGRELNTKEAYKQLAQKFHGHMPGKKKAEKRLQRIEDERKAKQAESMSLNTAQVVSEAIKQTGNAYITLSVGNRAAKLPTIAPIVQTKNLSPEVLPPLVVEDHHHVPLEDSETREKITFGLKRKAGSLEEEALVSKKSK